MCRPRTKSRARCRALFARCCLGWQPAGEHLPPEQQPEEERVVLEVTRSEPSGLLRHAVQPGQSGALNPRGRHTLGTRQHVKCAADADAYPVSEVWPGQCRPVILTRHTEAHENEFGAAAPNAVYAIG